MANLSYNYSPNLAGYLAKIKSLRSAILLKTISPRLENRLRWEAILSRTYWSLVLAGNSLNKQEMGRLLAAKTRHRLTKQQKDVVNYKKALDHISEDWLVTTRPVTRASVKRLFDIGCRETAEGASERSFRAAKKELVTFLDYLEHGSENPVVQAGIAQIQMIEIAPFLEGNGRVARLIPYLYLYKYGQDFRGLLVFDEFLRRDLTMLKEAIESVKKNKNMTLWLEYFAFGVVKQLEKTLKNMSDPKFSTGLPTSAWRLHSRQKEIVALLANPEQRITNKDVQKMFKVSQITASRDLAKLVKLGLLFSRGKGRSTYYIKV